jgi:S-formylglutathione hydrolase FrmB
MRHFLRQTLGGALIAVLCSVGSVSLRAEPAVAESTVIRSLSFKSVALGRQLQFSLYLPPGYNADDDVRKYPTVYLLHGHGGTDVSWLDQGGLRETADRLIAEGKLPPSIIVMPFAQTGWYVDSSGPEGTGRWQTAILEDLITYIDAKYPTITDGAARAIGGLSMGGYGALRFALMEPDEFAAAASLSGALFADVQSASEFPPFQIGLFGRAFGKTFDPAAFNAASPWRALAADDDAPEEAPALYMNWGDQDIPILAAGNAKFVESLKAARIPVTFSVSPGGHNWKLWGPQTPPMLAFLGARLKRGVTVAQTGPVSDATRVAAGASTPETIASGVKNAAPPPRGAAPALKPLAPPKPIVARP